MILILLLIIMIIVMKILLLVKIREAKIKDNGKIRGIGIPTLKGAVCATAKDREYLMNLIKKIPRITKDEITRIDDLNRPNICNEMKNKLLYLEKYSTSKDNNKMTYVMVPADHPIYDFPFNLEDRIKSYINKVNKACERNVDIQVKKNKGGKFLGNIVKDEFSYELSFNNEKFIDNNKDIQKELNKLGFKLDVNVWSKILD